MRALAALILIGLLIAAIATGVIYFTNDSQRASGNFDKQRAGEVLESAEQAGRNAAERLDQAIDPDPADHSPPARPALD